MTIALFTLSTLSAVIYHDDAIAGKGGGGNGGGNSGGNGGGNSGGNGGGNSGSSDGESVDHSNSGNKLDLNFGAITSRESYYKWLSDLLKE